MSADEAPCKAQAYPRPGQLPVAHAPSMASLAFVTASNARENFSFCSGDPGPVHLSGCHTRHSLRYAEPMAPSSLPSAMPKTSWGFPLPVGKGQQGDRGGQARNRPHTFTKPQLALVGPRGHWWLGHGPAAGAASGGCREAGRNPCTPGTGTGSHKDLAGTVKCIEAAGIMARPELGPRLVNLGTSCFGG